MGDDRQYLKRFSTHVAIGTLHQLDINVFDRVPFFSISHIDQEGRFILKHTILGALVPGHVMLSELVVHPSCYVLLAQTV